MSGPRLTLIVVDASIVVKWFVEEDDSSRARWAMRIKPVAPDLVLAETANVFRSKCARGQMAAVAAGEVLSGIGRTLQLFSNQPLVERSFMLAMGLQHAVYDCFYLALASLLDVPLLTADKRFAARCDGTEFASRVVTLADWEGAP